MTNLIYKISDNEYMINLFATGKIHLDYVDMNSKQTLEQFKNYERLDIVYSPNDFLFMIDEQKENEMINNKFIELSDVLHFGWYLTQKHNVNVAIYKEANYTTFKNLNNLNPTIRISSFDLIRERNKIEKIKDVLNGGIGLSYFCFRESYDKFLSKIEIENSKLIIPLSKLDMRTEYLILLQLLLYSESRFEKNILDKIFKDMKGPLAVYEIMRLSLNYFVNEKYSMSDYLNYLIDKIQKNDDGNLKSFIVPLKNINEKYAKLGLNYESKDKFESSIKEFLELGKTDLDKLPETINNNFSKTSIFLLGMLNLGSRIQDVFGFDYFIPTVVELISGNIIAADVFQDKIELYLDENFVINDRNKRFTYFKKYIEELKEIQNFNKQYVELDEIYKSFCSYDVEFKSVQAVNAKINELTIKKEDLIGKCNNLETEIKNQSQIYNEIKYSQTKLLQGIDKERKELAKLLDEFNKITQDIEKIKNDLAKKEEEKKKLETKNENADAVASEIKNEIKNRPIDIPKEEKGEGDKNQNSDIKKQTVKNIDNDSQRNTSRKKITKIKKHNQDVDNRLL